MAVVAGVSGRFPKDRGLKLFHESIFDYPVHQDPSDIEIADLKHQHEDFFKISDQRSNSLQPVVSTMSELIFEAVADAGLSSQNLTLKTSFFVEFLDGGNESDLNTALLILDNITAIFNFRCNTNVFKSNYNVGMQAFKLAIRTLTEEEAEMAIVFAVNETVGDFVEKTEKLKTTDSEIMCAVLLQKSGHVKREYAEVTVIDSAASIGQTDCVELHSDITYSHFYDFIKHLDDKITIQYSANCDKNNFLGLADIIRNILYLEKSMIWPVYTTDVVKINKINDCKKLEFLKESIPCNHRRLALCYFNENCENTIILLEGAKANPHQHYSTDEPRILTYGAPTKDKLANLLKDAFDISKNNLEFHSLLQGSASYPMPLRGFTLLNSPKETLTLSSVELGNNRPLWFVVPGYGTAWHGMGRDMMKIKLFKDYVVKYSNMMEKHGLDFYDQFMNKDESWWGDVKNQFIGIAVISIIQIDMLFAMGIKPDGILGHSLGESICSYADECVTADELLQAIYKYGACISDSKLPLGKMAAVGLSWDECAAVCPEGVFPACNNAADSVTVTGPVARVNRFVADMKAKGIKASHVCMSFNPHCPLAAEIESKTGLRDALENTITTRPRSPRWISTSYTEDRWKEEGARFFNGDYIVNNYLSPVYFHEGAQKIPPNAVVVEIGPTSVFKNILKKTLGSGIVCLSLMEKGGKDTDVFLNTLGKLYNLGFNFDPMKLYPGIKFPVSPGTQQVGTYISKIW